jgi:hypothetical protein
VIAAQDMAHGQLVDMMSQIRQGSLDPSIAPRRIFLCHVHDQLFDLFCDTRAARRLTMVTAIELLRDEAMVPAQEGLGRRKGRKRLSDVYDQADGRAQRGVGARCR